MDRRERETRWYINFDPKRMIVTLENDDNEEVDIPVKYEVCDTCEGRGSHVNPSIDGNGLSQEDFDEDPDFREDYFSGMYDVSCNECHGQRVVPAIDETRATPEQKQLVEDRFEELYRSNLERDAERRMGY